MLSPRIARVAVSFSLAAILTLPDHALAQGISRGGMGGGVGRGGYVGGRMGGRAGVLVRPGGFRTAPHVRFGPSARAFHPRDAISFNRRIVRGGFRGRFDRPAVRHVSLVLRRHDPGFWRFPRHHFGFRFPRRHLGFFGFPRHHFGFFGFPHHHFGFFGFPHHHFHHHFGFFFGSPFVRGFGFSGFPFVGGFPVLGHHFGFFGFPRHPFGAFGFPHPFGLFGPQTWLVGAPLGWIGGPYATSTVAVRDTPQGFEARPTLGRQLAVPGTGVAGDSLVVERISVMDVVPATAVRLTWRNAGLDAEQVVLFLADTAQSTLVAQTLRRPPYTALFEPPPGTAFAGMNVMWPDGTTSARVVPYRTGPR